MAKVLIPTGFSNLWSRLSSSWTFSRTGDRLPEAVVALKAVVSWLLGVTRMWL